MFILISIVGVVNVESAASVESAMKSLQNYRDLSIQDTFNRKDIVVNPLKAHKLTS